jgi:antitoxin HicB
VITFRDILEAITQGDDEAESIFMACDVLRVAMGFYFDENLPAPPPSTAHRDYRLIDLPISIAAKVWLLNEMLAEKVSASELGRRLEITRQTAARLTKLEHATRIDQVDAALQTLGEWLILDVAAV